MNVFVVHLRKALLCLSGALALLIAAKVSAFVRNSEQISKDIALALNCPGRNEDNVKRFQSNYKDASSALKKKNLFMTPLPQKTNPVTSVTAVFGDEACISDNWYKVGDKINDAEITNILPNEVTIVWNDQEAKLKPFDTVSMAPPSRQSSSDKDRYKEKYDKNKKDKKETKNSKPEHPNEARPVGKPNLSDEERKKRMQEYMNRLTPEQKAAWEERMKSRGSSSRDPRSSSNDSSRNRGSSNNRGPVNRSR